MILSHLKKCLNKLLKNNSNSFIQEKSLLRNGGTTILLLHNGQPRTNYHIRQHLTSLLEHNFCIPSYIGRIADCLRDSANQPFLGNLLSQFANDVEQSLSTLLPAFAPVKCLPSYLHESPCIADNIAAMFREKTTIDHLIIVSMYPFYTNYVSKALLYAALPPLKKLSTTKLSIREGEWQSFVAKDGHAVSFSYLFFTEMGTFDSFMRCWAHELLRKFESDIGGIIFAVPSAMFWGGKESNSKLVESVSTLVREMHSASKTAIIPMRIAYFKSWNELIPTFFPSIKTQLKALRKAGREGTIFIVPIANLIDDFDTQTILPSLTYDLEDVRLVQISEIRDALLNTFVELLKTRLCRSSNKN